MGVRCLSRPTLREGDMRVRRGRNERALAMPRMTKRWVAMKRKASKKTKVKAEDVEMNSGEMTRAVRNSFSPGQMRVRTSHKKITTITPLTSSAFPSVNSRLGCQIKCRRITHAVMTYLAKLPARELCIIR
jgi:hypothetical protein